MLHISDGQLDSKQYDKVEVLIESEKSRWIHRTDFTISEHFFHR